MSGCGSRITVVDRVREQAILGCLLTVIAGIWLVISLVEAGVSTFTVAAMPAALFGLLAESLRALARATPTPIARQQVVHVSAIAVPFRATTTVIFMNGLIAASFFGGVAEGTPVFAAGALGLGLARIMKAVQTALDPAPESRALVSRLPLFYGISGGHHPIVGYRDQVHVVLESGDTAP